MDVEKTIREYLPQVIHMSLGTCSGGKPWVSEVHYVYDDDLNLYFRSKTARRHSEEIANNENVAGNIVTQHVVDEKVRGIYFEGRAKLLEDVDEDHVAYKFYCERFDTDEEILEEAKTEDGHKFYMISVDNFFLFDAHNSPGKKYELPWPKK